MSVAFVSMVALGGCGAQSESDPMEGFDEAEFDQLNQALNSNCGNSSPDRSMNSSYSNSDIKSGFGSFDYQDNHNTCGLGYFVQIASWKPYGWTPVPRFRIPRPSAEYQNLSQSDCDGGVVRIYVWYRNSQGSWVFSGAANESLYWSNGTCNRTFSKSTMVKLEDDLVVGGRPRRKGEVCTHRSGIGRHSTSLRDRAHVASACSDPGEYYDEETLSIDQPLMGGTTSTGNSGGVSLRAQGDGGCTGVLVGANMVLTAKHCVDAAIGSAEDSSAAVQVRTWNFGSGQGAGSASWKCMTGATDANNNCTSFQNARIHVLSGSGAGKDFAVIVRKANATWTNTNNRAFGLYTGSIGVGFSYEIQGAGAVSHDGTPAAGLLELGGSIDDKGTTWLRTYATSSKRICWGDSGGPLGFASELRWVIGLHSRSEHPSSTKACTKNGGDETHFRMRTSVVEDIINPARIAEGHAPCSRHPDDRDFWLCS